MKTLLPTALIAFTFCIGSFAAIQEREQAPRTGKPMEPAQSQGKGKSRRVDVMPGERLLSKLQPSDTVLEINDGYIPPSGPPLEPGQTRIGELTKATTFVALVRVKRVKSEMRRDETWIDSTVQADIQQIFKNTSNQELHEGGSVTFVVPDGAVQVRKQLIRAFRHGAKPFVPGWTYLIFGQLRDGQLWTSAMESYLIQGDTVVKMFPEPDGEDESDRLPTNAQDLMQEVLSWSQVPKPR